MAIEGETVDQSLEGSFEPEDASSDSFLEDARKAVLEEAGQAPLQENETQEEGNTENQEELVPEKVEDSELDKPFIGSRREAYRLAEERAKLLEDSNAKNVDLQRQLDEQRVADEELTRDVTAALATEEEYQNLEYRALSGDVRAGQELLQIKANRAFYGKLEQKASRNISSYFTSQLVETAKEAGLPEEVVFKGTPSQIVKSAFEAGQAKAEAQAQEKIDSLEAELKQAKTSRVSRSAGGVLTGGRSSSSGMSDLFGEDGLPTDEAIEAARRGRLSLPI